MWYDIRSLTGTYSVCRLLAIFRTMNAGGLQKAADGTASGMAFQKIILSGVIYIYGNGRQQTGQRPETGGTE